jgi:hypothetical protein
MVTQMVLVGRGGLRLHEEIFLAGVRLRGRDLRLVPPQPARVARAAHHRRAGGRVDTAPGRPAALPRHGHHTSPP